MEDGYLGLKKPKNENAKIWRYMDFTKFVSLIDKHALFFPRISLLGDKFEGSIPKQTYPDFSREQKDELRQSDPDGYEKFIANDNNARKEAARWRKAQRNCTFVNSWHMSEFESAAMWKLYLKTDEGIAIQSTYSRLAICLSASKIKVYLGMVRYVNYSSEYPFNVASFPFICKRKSFEHEKELRAIIMKHPTDYVPNTSVRIPNGIEIPVILDSLIEEVYVSPTAEKWFEDLDGLF
jgi:hypothetical protein